MFSAPPVADVEPRWYGFPMRALVLASVIGVFQASGVLAADHIEMRGALREIETARRHLEAAKQDYRGHRTAAVEELRRAEEQIRKGLEKAAPTKEPE